MTWKENDILLKIWKKNKINFKLFTFCCKKWSVIYLKAWNSFFKGFNSVHKKKFKKYFQHFKWFQLIELTLKFALKLKRKWSNGGNFNCHWDSYIFLSEQPQFLIKMNLDHVVRHQSLLAHQISSLAVIKGQVTISNKHTKMSDDI